MPDADPSAHIRSRAEALADQGRKLRARAEAMPDGRMREMLEAQATLLIEGARDLALKALELTPAAGTA
jgi:hypothetical protein